MVILVDDMGYADIGSYGGEIQTDALDALANNGVRYTRFYNTGRCTPTRASLLTGRYPHDVGVGHLNSDRGLAGYRGTIEAAATTLPEALSPAGYQTFMVGKWHLSRNVTSPDGTWPHQRGFDRFYGSMEGAKNYFSPSFMFDLTKNGPVVPVNTFPNDYFYTEDISTHAADFITQADPSRPLFMYVAFYAPHFPLQAPQAKTDEYLQAGTYANGWDPIRSQRLANQIALGINMPGAQLTPRPSDVPSWSSLSASKRAEMELRMSVYAAQVELMDEGVARIVSALRASGRYDDTMILFCSDNGAVSGGGFDGTGNSVGQPSAPVNTRYGNAWANASNTPHRQYKSRNHEGGISTPLIVHWPDGIAPARRGSIDTSSRGHIIDIMPTVLDLAGVAPEPEVAGVSLAPTFTGNGNFDNGRMMYWEHEGRRAVSDGDYKAVAIGPGSSWELYDIVADRIESQDLAGQSSMRARLDALVASWEAWAVETDALPWPWSPQYNLPEPPVEPPACSLLTHLKFDGASYRDGDSVADSSRNDNDGVVSADDTSEHSVASGVPGLGNAFDFDGDIVDVDLRGLLPTRAAARTISVWFNSDRAANGNRVFGYGSLGQGEAFIIACQGSTSDLRLALRVASAVVTYTPAANARFTTGDWAHAVCVVPDNASSILDVDMYINGVIASKAVTTGNNLPLATQSSYFGVGMFGALGVPGGSQASNAFDGRVADIQVYREAVTPAQAAFLFANPGEALSLQEQGCFPAATEKHGDGCQATPSSQPMELDVAVGEGPVLGETIGMLASNVDTAPTPGLLAYGLQRQVLDLGVIGAPGCSLTAALLAATPAFYFTPVASLSLTVPNEPALLGSFIQLQAIALAPGANALGVIASNGLELRFGDA